jgi:spore maturation protein CgeB
MFIDQTIKYAKGFVQLGHDFRSFSYSGLLQQLSPVKSRQIKKFFYKNKADRILLEYARHYKPDIVIIASHGCFDLVLISRLREAIPDAVLIGVDGDPWPKLIPSKMNAAKGFDILMATNDGQWLQDYRNAGSPLCCFIPNMCDPSIDRRYGVEEKWKTDILWIGALEHHADTSVSFRRELILELAKRDNCSLFGCCGRPKITGLDSLYAISGASIGVNVNAYGDIRLAHSDRLTRFLAGGTMVMAKRFPDCELLYKDGVHLKYFDTIEEFFELSDWYLNHENERKKIADAGMKWVHEQFNCTRIAGYILELAEKGKYSSPWFDHLSTAEMNR